MPCRCNCVNEQLCLSIRAQPDFGRGSILCVPTKGNSPDEPKCPRSSVPPDWHMMYFETTNAEVLNILISSNSYDGRWRKKDHESTIYVTSMTKLFTTMNSWMEAWMCIFL